MEKWIRAGDALRGGLFDGISCKGIYKDTVGQPI